MRFDVVTIFPELAAAVGRYGVVGRAMDARLVELATWNPRDFTEDRHRNVDDRPYGGGPGMVMQAAPLMAAVEAARGADSAQADVVYMTPQGRRFDQATAEDFARRDRLILVAGRYEGVDERFVERCVDMELSLGDFVLSGGELAAMAVIDAVTRLLPGALGHESSAAEDSFADGLLDHPHYTRPEQFAGRGVPDVLTSGDHCAIRRWRLKQALGRTWLRRPELLTQAPLDTEARALLEEFIAEQGERAGTSH
ncbi:MAG TPA: tRNA (guanosine(37)-N1)-methyltransferase TrmD [Gammaproteobacteria bacterium]|nr:tRNA (guanosine(37)-N1)-methyltransferase TrmD [Gammaproteobacteria bacterium]